MKKLSTLLVLLTTLFIAACSSDSETPKEQFKADGETLSLSNAKLYLMRETDINAGHGPFVSRDYFFTDGTYSEGNGWSIDHYTNATYLLAFQTLIPADDDFNAGTFAAAYSFNDVESGRGLYFYAQTATPVEYYETNDGDMEGIFTVSGAMNADETMTVKFNGTLSHFHYVGEVFTETLFTGKILVKGTVIDMRP